MAENNSSSDEDKPLSVIRQMNMKQEIRRSLFDAGSSDDSFGDPSFDVKKADVNSSDSEYECLRKEMRLKKKKVRDKTWKKKVSSLNNKQKNVPGRPGFRKFVNRGKRNSMSSPKKYKTNVYGNTVEKAKQESHKQHRAMLILYRYHEKTLDTLLHSNGLEKVSIPKDGNCFFESIIKSPNASSFETASELREHVCNFFCTNKEKFKQFLEQANEEEFYRQVEDLRKPGHWSNSLSDAIPLATAHVIGKDIKIFTSDRKQPVIEITRGVIEEIGNRKEESQPITLAYIRLRGTEHYDACQQFQKSPTKPSPMKKTSDEETHGTGHTPRKQAVYKSPQRIKTSRKRKANPNNWAKNIRKKMRLEGKSYINAKGKMVLSKKVQPVNCSRCKLKCTSNITQEEQQKLFDTYWSLGSYERQKDFLCRNIRQSEPKRRTCKAKFHRSAVRKYFFAVDGHEIHVCKNFFLKTLNIGERTVETAMRSYESGVFFSSDKRGKHRPHNKLPDPVIQNVKNHIESFPTVESHYTRKHSQRLYLDHDLNITKMYELYKDYCHKNDTNAVSQSKYRQIFCENYNYAFHKPKKDQCQTCAIYQDTKVKGEITTEMETNYKEHIRRKDRARAEKEHDKDFAIEKNNYHTAVFDLEAVLTVPCSLVSQVYYKRKLCCYNLSIFSLANRKVSCYLWNETDGKRGSNEISSCLQMYLQSLPTCVSHVCLFSDSCSGQNRNRIIATSLLNYVKTSKTINIIDQKFLETGHTQMEVDSVHATIERAKKATSIFVPSQYETVIRMARRKNPYTVIPLKYNDFVDYKSISSGILPASLHDNLGQKVQWMKLKWIQYRERDPDNIYFKYDFDDEEFRSMRTKHTRRSSLSSDPRPSYKGKLPIPSAKKEDLVSLCKSGIIPEEFHCYYEKMVSKSDKNLKSESDSESNATDEDSV